MSDTWPSALDLQSSPMTVDSRSLHYRAERQVAIVPSAFRHVPLATDPTSWLSSHVATTGPQVPLPAAADIAAHGCLQPIAEHYIVMIRARQSRSPTKAACLALIASSCCSYSCVGFSPSARGASSSTAIGASSSLCVSGLVYCNDTFSCACSAP